MPQTFDAYSAYYDLFYRDKPYAAEAAWVVERIELYLSQSPKHTCKVNVDDGIDQPSAGDSVPTGGIGLNLITLLDVGCGTGAYSREFAKLGYSVRGIDLSKAMIDRAQAIGGDENYASRLAEREHTNPQYEQGDARTWRAAKYNNEPFDVVTMMFHVFSYQASNDDVSATLETCAANLKSGGILAFDVWHQEAVLAQKPEVRERNEREDLEQGSSIIAKRKATPHHDEAAHVVTVHYDIKVHKLGGSNGEVFSGETHTLAEDHRMRYFSQTEIEALLAEHGFELLEAAELVTGAPPSIDTWGVCYVAKKH